MDTFNSFENGILEVNGVSLAIKDIKWNEHSAFKGVFLKNLLKSTDTGGVFSTHLVKIEPGAEIGSHVHTDNAELHEVIAGDGCCIMEKRRISYSAGVCTFIDTSSKHRVIADKNGLFLFAKIFPALL